MLKYVRKGGKDDMAEVGVSALPERRCLHLVVEFTKAWLSDDKSATARSLVRPVAFLLLVSGRS